MEDLKRHEVFEIETLDVMNSGKFLERMVFGGGTMLRLCHELNRYSADLDFWFIKKTNAKAYLEELGSFLSKSCEITDSCVKYNTLLIELRSGKYPKKLKIEVRKREEGPDVQEVIAFSRYSNKQVLVKAHTLEETMKRKIGAAIGRKEIRDYFDIEFLIRRGIPLPDDGKKLAVLRKNVAEFKERDFKVTLGSTLDAADREYYSKNGFDFLSRKIEEACR